jgi:hypothetical protein
MSYPKSKLLKIVGKVSSKQPLTTAEVELILNFEKKDKESVYISLAKRLAVPLAIIFGITLAAFASEFEKIEKNLPWWTNLPAPLLSGADYIWGFIGEPVGKANILYHLPNIILYSFGIVGLKKVFDAIDRRTWLDSVIKTKDEISEKLKNGAVSYSLKKGHSILFVGKGDFIGIQFALNTTIDNCITISESKPQFTYVWSKYNSDSGFEDLEQTLKRADYESAGEYVFFPVKDDQVFLPNAKAYDLSPHKLDILFQDIRSIEKRNKLSQRRIIIVGDRYHKSVVYSEDKDKRVKGSRDVISIESISKKYKGVTVIDPTDIVMKRIIKIANGRRVVFRATIEGIEEYKDRFFKRLVENGYRRSQAKKGTLTIGYDIFEDQTEQQTLAKTVDGYYPVVLSKTVRDALIRNGYKSDEFLYVPDLVLSVLKQKASEQ